MNDMTYIHLIANVFLTFRNIFLTVIIVSAFMLSLVVCMYNLYVALEKNGDIANEIFENGPKAYLFNRLLVNNLFFIIWLCCAIAYSYFSFPVFIEGIAEIWRIEIEQIY